MSKQNAARMALAMVVAIGAVLLALHFAIGGNWQ